MNDVKKQDDDQSLKCKLININNLNLIKRIFLFVSIQCKCKSEHFF